MRKKAVVIYSGGMDSFTVLHKARRQGYQVYALTFDYSQRHRKEIDYASAVCQDQGIAHRVIDISAVKSLLGGSALTDDIEVPQGHYEDASMKSTVVPNRNMILLALATGYAVSLQADKVFFGAHGGDHAIYPDCRPAFVEQMNQVTRIANYQPVAICCPYLHKDKTDILADGLAMGLDYAQTWTCYNGRELACGRCGACIERLEAFRCNGVRDPLAYE